VPRNAELSVEHEREGDSEEVELQMRWKIAGGQASPTTFRRRRVRRRVRRVHV
jgi:hypothetical protein